MSSLVKQSNFPSVKSLMEDFWNTDRFFGSNLFRDSLPAINVIDKKDHFEVELAAPGFAKHDFKVDIDQGVLTISAETSKDETIEDGNYTRKEFSRESFARSFTLPPNVKETDIKARYEEGVLKMSIGKSAGAGQPKNPSRFLNGRSEGSFQGTGE